MLQLSEAIVLRTYPMHESDLLVTLFTRNEGKIKGVAKAAKRSKRRFGGALEPLTIVRAQYEHKPRQELARFDAFDNIEGVEARQLLPGFVLVLGAHDGERLERSAEASFGSLCGLRNALDFAFVPGEDREDGK